MERRLDWPGRGLTWLGVSALIVAVGGALLLLDVLPRQSLSRELLDVGHFAIADTVRIDVESGTSLGLPSVAAVYVSFPTADGARLETPLVAYEYDAQGMTDGVQTPRPGTRYAAPLQVVYTPAAPRQALAMLDARQWTDDHRTPRIATGLLAGGATIGYLAATRDRRWRWRW